MDEGARQFSGGRWWQWVDGAWVLEPAPPGEDAPEVTDEHAPPVPLEEPAVTATSTAGVGGWLRKFWWIPAIVIVVLLVLGAVLLFRPKPSLFADAVQKCDATGTYGVDVGDGGQSLVVDTKGKEDFGGASFEQLACLLAALKVPDATLNEISRTSSLDGVQSAQWDNIKASWKYHPDPGMNITFTLN